jgi:hypothetical protein
MKPLREDIVLRFDVHSVDRLLDRDGSPLIGPRIHPEVARAIRAETLLFSHFPVRRARDLTLALASAAVTLEATELDSTPPRTSREDRSSVKAE